MITGQPLTPEQRASSQKNNYIFNAFNGLSYMCLGETVIILLAVRLGAPDAVISMLGAMIYFGFLLLPLGKYVTMRAGAVRSQCVFWRLRNAAALLVAAAVPVSFWFGLNWAVVTVLAGAFLFYGFRAAGVVMIQPLYREITVAGERASFIALSNQSFYITSIVALVAISGAFALFDQNIVVLTGVVISGSVFGFISTRYIDRICESGAIRQAAARPLRGGIRQLLKSPFVPRMFAAGFVCNLGVIMIVPVSMLTLKRGFGVSDAKALLFSLVVFLFCIIASKPVALLSSRFGPRKVIIVSYLVLMGAGSLWIAAPSESHWYFEWLPFALIGTAAIGTGNAMTHYFLQVVKRDQLVTASILSALISSAGAGAFGMALAAGLMWLCGRMLPDAEQLTVYRLYFGIALAMLIPAYRVIANMLPLPVERRNFKRAWYDFLW
ncbi:MAG: hypothetical protein AB7F40_05840 [Victivallaceae bacterium]|nr:hypothetical protein [Victivallaceae bacterium]